MKIDELDTPVLLIDLDAMERNMARMAELARDAGIACRPHAKAHKSPDIARLQIERGAVGICCAKLGEAEVMAAAGIPDILITTPVIGVSKLMRLMMAASQSRIAVVADNADNIREMAMCAQTAGVRIAVVVEIDVGQGRCGVPPGEAALALARQIHEADWLIFRGLQGYQGKIQQLPGFAERADGARAALEKLAATARLIRDDGIPVEVLTGGGTGTSAIDAAGHGLTEIQPGGYLFMDARYGAIEWQDGGRVPFEQSLSVLSSVISLPGANRCILDMGLKSVSSDQGPPVPVGLDGAVFSFAGEEHGMLTWDGAACPLAIGAKARFLPTHCDTTVNLYDRFIAVRGDEIDRVIEIAARGRSQ